jgi:hypothetical protein
MKQRPPVSFVSFYFLTKLASAGLGLAIAAWPLLAAAQCLTWLKGKTYTTLPTNLCPKYTDMLLGRTLKQQEYSGIICDRPEASYILLQRLVRYTQQGKAVWQITQVKPIPKPNAQSLILGTGCRLQPPTSSAIRPIFALVQSTANSTYQTLSAWQVNLDKESFADLEPQQVICKDTLE